MRGVAFESFCQALKAHLCCLLALRQSYIKAVIATVTLGALSWAGFLAFVTNGEKSSSSVFRQVMFVMRTSSLVDEKLGESVVLEKTWWTGGEPWYVYLLDGPALRTAAEDLVLHDG